MNKWKWINHSISLFFVVVFFCTCWAYLKESWSKVGIFVLLSGINFFLVSLLRIWVKKPRPLGFNRIDKPRDERAWPSRHSYSAFYIAMSSFGLGFPVFLLSMLMAMGLGYVRIYSRVHDIHDVLSGAILGVLLALVTRCLVSSLF